MMSFAQYAREREIKSNDYWSSRAARERASAEGNRMLAESCDGEEEAYYIRKADHHDEIAKAFDAQVKS